MLVTVFSIDLLPITSRALRLSTILGICVKIEKAEAHVPRKAFEYTKTA